MIYHKVSKNLPTIPAQISKFRGCCTNQNVLGSFRNGWVIFLPRKLIASISYPNSKLNCPYSFLKSHKFEFIVDLYSLHLACPCLFSSPIRQSLDFDQDLGLVRKTQRSWLHWPASNTKMVTQTWPFFANIFMPVGQTLLTWAHALGLADTEGLWSFTRIYICLFT